MDESEKRRERLKAMRMEASQSVDNTDPSSGVASSGLSNPLIESETTTTTPHRPRFDFYTDPMAAFSGNRRSNNITHHVPQGHHNPPSRPIYQGMNPPPAYQNSDPRMSQISRPYYNQGPNPDPRMYQAPQPYYNPGPPGISTGPPGPSGRPPGYPPGHWGAPGGTFNYRSPPNLSRGPRGDSPYPNYGQGRGQMYNNNPNSQYDSGRGRGRSRGNYNNMNSRGVGPRGPDYSEEFRPEKYYMKEMLEDPWEGMTPVVWKPPVWKKSWLPVSIASKKSRISPEASSHKSISQPSLAEYLNATFGDLNNEAVDEKKQEDT